ncbi:MAG: hypothetical protein JW715_11430 [Sedimentisphaerales bacterium]|nr:hypothetical protein [Sedimentisphaerales bacterium]
MLEKRTVFILGAGASCPYGYPSGEHLRRRICLLTSILVEKQKELISAIGTPQSYNSFKNKFENSSTKSIDLFMARNPKLAPIGKILIAFEIFEAEQRSLFRERAEWEQYRRKMQGYVQGQDTYLMSKDFQGSIWYEYLFDRLTSGLATKDNLPDFSNGNLSFISFNYDRSLEYFLYESLRNSFTEVTEEQIIQCLKRFKILHVYGQIAPLRWQDDANGVDYHPQITSSLLKGTSSNIRTIYEQQDNPELSEAKTLISQAEQIFFLGFGYAKENMDVLNMPSLIPPSCQVYGTAFGMVEKEVKNVLHTMRSGRKADSNGYRERYDTMIESCDCLMLLREYL